MFEILKYIHPMLDDGEGDMGGGGGGAMTDTSNTGDEGQGDAGSGDVGADGKAQDTKNTAAQNAAFAQMRREAAEAKKYMERANKVISDIYGKDFGIKSVDELEAAYAKQQQDAQKEALQASGLDPDLITKLVNDGINSHPAVKQAQEFASRAAKEAADRALVDQFNELRKTFPEVTTKDITPAMWEKQNKGYSLKDAYMSENMDAIMKKSQARGEQSALNTIAGKKHMFSNTGGSTGDASTVEMDAATLAMYMRQGLTKEQAYAKHKKYYSS